MGGGVQGPRRAAWARGRDQDHQGRALQQRGCARAVRERRASSRESIMRRSSRCTTRASFEDGTLFIVMEWLDGFTLAHAMKSHGPGTPAQVAVLLREGASALGAAHAAGLVHRDVKLENIFLIPSTGRATFTSRSSTSVSPGSSPPT